MRLPKLAIENHQFTLIVFILMLVLGITSFVTMPRSEDPPISPPGTGIIVILPGGSPSDIEELIVEPIENELNELSDIKEIHSSMQDGLAHISIEFINGSDPDKKYSEVIQKVNSIREELPDEIYTIDFIKWESTDIVILQTALISETASYDELKSEAERLQDRLETVPDVKDIEIMAFREQEVRVSLDMGKMAAKNVSFSMIIQAVSSENMNIPGGSIDIGKKRFSIRTSGSYNKLEDIRNTVVSSYDGKVVYLKDIADVRFDYRDRSYIARANGKRAVLITATQKANTNIYDVMDGLKAGIKDFSATLPGYITCEILIDQSLNVSNRLTGFFENLLQGLVLVGFVVFLIIGPRPSLIVIVAIPLSILMGILFIDFSGYGIQQISIAGLVISLGLLVDNAIVVTENIDRFMNQGYPPEEAAALATSQIGWAVSSSTITTVLAFVPVIMIGDMTGEFIRSMPLIVMYTLFSSLLISLTLTPYLASRFLRTRKDNRMNFLRRAVDKFVNGFYDRILNLAIKNPAKVLVISVVVFMMSLSLFPFIGVSFFPKSDRPQFMIEINLPAGYNLDETDMITRKVEEILKKKEHIRVYVANVGKGNPRVYYNILQKQETANYAEILIELDQFGEEILNEVILELRKDLENFTGVEINVREFEQGPPVDAPIAIRAAGENIDVLRKISLDMEKIFRETEGVINVNNPLKTTKSDLKISVNRDKAAFYGIPVIEIDRTIRAAINGLAISEFRDDSGNKFDITLRLPVNGKTKFDDFSRIYVSSVTGKQIPLNLIASIAFEESPLKINHYNFKRNVLITGDVIKGYSVNDATQEILRKIEDYNWPGGYSYSAAGELKTRKESFGDMYKAVFIAVLGIIAVLVLQFKSISQPLIIFSAIPLALIGSLIFLLMTGYTFSFLAFVGLTSLIGIVVNNSIILVDYTNQLLPDGKQITEAIIEAAKTRFVPILVTTSTTIGGLLPLTIAGGSLWGPMGWTIIGGLIFSTALTLIVTPVLYKVFTKTKS